MRGNAQFYRRKTLENEEELRKLLRAKKKHQKMLDNIDRDISKMELLLKQNMHCLSVQCAESMTSTITE